MRRPRLIAAAIATLCLQCGLAPLHARAGTAPTIVPLPPGAVSIQSCHWTATRASFDADIKVKDHTNLKIAKSRFLLTFIDAYGEKVQAYADMVNDNVALVPGMPMTGRWVRGTFPLGIKTMTCALVGVKFNGYPDVVFSALK